MKNDNKSKNDEVSHLIGQSVPADKKLRNRIKSFSAEHVTAKNLAGPLSVSDLKKHAESVLSRVGIGAEYLSFAAVMINNELWRKGWAAVPYQRRLLLLPKCLRDINGCRAKMDEFGFLCDQCGGCLIGEVHKEAERLGYAVLVAEGTPVVMSLISSGQVEAVLGVGCLSSLEGVFPYMEAGAIPGLAVPLLNDGCESTSVDEDLVWEAIYEKENAEGGRMNFAEIRGRVECWFTPEKLSPLINPQKSETGELAVEWLTRAGKRWRPLLLACARQALVQKGREIPGSVMNASVAIECFHKASLVHDDIEDGDSFRYGHKTLHALYGVPVALNVGDYLIGEGYRLLSELNEPEHIKTKILSVAAKGHKTLCMGQGKELLLRRSRGGLTVENMIDIFQKKTAPAFQVALQIGAVLAQKDEEFEDVLSAFTDALGIAYQIKDDLADNDFDFNRPSILLALAFERAEKSQKNRLDSLWRGDELSPELLSEAEQLRKSLQTEPAAEEMMKGYKIKAVAALSEVNHSPFKSLLRILAGKIFDDLEELKCCDDYKG